MKEKMKIVNLTPHSLHIYSPEGELVLEVESSGSLRIPEEYSALPAIGEIPVVRKQLGLPKIPPQEDGTIYVVSLPALMAFKAMGEERSDIYAPETGAYAVRDDNGRIIGTEALCQL